jgi:hypothetical protein
MRPPIEIPLSIVIPLIIVITAVLALAFDCLSEWWAREPRRPNRRPPS